MQLRGRTSATKNGQFFSSLTSPSSSRGRKSEFRPQRPRATLSSAPEKGSRDQEQLSRDGAEPSLEARDALGFQKQLHALDICKIPPAGKNPLPAGELEILRQRGNPNGAWPPLRSRRPGLV